MDVERLLTEITETLRVCAASTFADLPDNHKLRLLSDAVRIQDQLHGALMPAVANVNDSNAFRTRKSSAASSTSMVLASDMNMRRGTAGRIINQADTATKIIPKIHAAYAAGTVSSCQFNKLTSVADQPKYRDIVGDYQNYFLNLCHFQYPKFAKRIDEWCEELDPIDPADLDAKAYDHRSFVSAQGLGREVLSELKLPNAEHDLLMSVLEPFYDTLLKKEYRDAAEARELDSSLSDIELAQKLTIRDLARTKKQRYADALLMAMRAANLVTKPAIEKLANGETLTIGDIDPGAVAQLIVVCDQETLEREICRRSGIEVDPRTPNSLAKRRCETLAGRTLSPSQVVDLAPLMTIRRMLHEQTELDFTLSQKQRFFTALQRLGMIVRDRTCATPGCSVPAYRCEADHTDRFADTGVTKVAQGRMRCPACHRHKTRLESLGLWRSDVVDPETGARGLTRNLFGDHHEHPSSKARRVERKRLQQHSLNRERQLQVEREQLAQIVGARQPVS